MEKYSLLGLESDLKCAKECKQNFKEKILDKISDEDTYIVSNLIGYVDSYINILENKIQDAKLNTYVEL